MRTGTKSSATAGDGAEALGAEALGVEALGVEALGVEALGVELGSAVGASGRGPLARLASRVAGAAPLAGLGLFSSVGAGGPAAGAPMGTGSGRLAAAATTLGAASGDALGAGASESDAATAADPGVGCDNAAIVGCDNVAIAAVVADAAARTWVPLEGGVSAALRDSAAGFTQSYFHRWAVGMSGIADMDELR